MRHALILTAVLALAAPLLGADIPDGSSATLTAVAGTGCIKIANGDRVYYLPTHEVVGVQAKSNGCSITMRTDKGTETRDFTTISADDFVALIKAAK
jgi:hypothetical protein